MRFDLVTLFPDLIRPFLELGVTRRAFAPGGPVQVLVHDLRDHAQGNYRRVDDRPFGGGPGMVLMAEPLAACVRAVHEERARAGGDQPAGPRAPVVLFTPAGRRLDHREAQSWAGGAGAILICGRYEGVDQRFVDRYVDIQISVGDLVLSGGELPALMLLDAVARLVPGVLGDEGSAVQDSFHPAVGGMLDCPHYTRPEVWEGQAVPEVLMSGHHERIERWREAQRLALTRSARPDLL